MIPRVWDLNDGIALEFDFENGTSFTVNMEDEAVKDLIAIMQNKLNGRFTK